MASPSAPLPVQPGDVVTCLYCTGDGTQKQETTTGLHFTGKIALCRFCEGTGKQVVQEEAVVDPDR